MDVSPNGGVIKVDQDVSSYPVTYSFESGTNVRLEAVPTFGYRFNNWSGDLSDTNNPTNIVIDYDKNIVANFSVNWHLLGGITGSTGLIVFLVIVLIIRRG